MTTKMTALSGFAVFVAIGGALFALHTRSLAVTPPLPSHPATATVAPTATLASGDSLSQCLGAEGMTAASVDSGAAAHTSAWAEQTARGWHAAFATAQIQETGYVVVSGPVVGDGSVVGAALAHHLWAVDFTGLHIAIPGGAPSLSGTPSPARYASGEVVILDDATGKTVFAVFCI